MRRDTVANHSVLQKSVHKQNILKQYSAVEIITLLNILVKNGLQRHLPLKIFLKGLAAKLEKDLVNCKHNKHPSKLL